MNRILIMLLISLFLTSFVGVPFISAGEPYDPLHKFTEKDFMSKYGKMGLPIKDAELKRRILDLAERTGVSIEDVSLIDFSRKTVKANAALGGLGGTRKVVLSDTLAEKFTPEEVEAVVAHEFGHLKYRHIQALEYPAIETMECISGVYY